MRLLALDTATEACSVALIDGDALIGREAELARGHTETLLAMIGEVLAEGGYTFARLDGLAASIGPGSFTGVRVGVSVAQGLALGAGLPVVPVTTLEALAAQVRGGADERVLACLDARMGEVYWAGLRTDPARGVAFEGRPAVGAPGTVRPPWGPLPCRGIGRGFDAHPSLAGLPGVELDPGHRRALPRAHEMARLGALRLALGLGGDPAELQPLYLRDKVALTEAERAAK